MRVFNLKLVLTILLAFIFSNSLYSSEVDSFTLRYSPLKDSTQVINFKTNELLKERLVKLNKRSKPCTHERRLYRHLLKDFGLYLIGTKLVRWIKKNKKEIERNHIKVKNSIYRDWNFSETPMSFFDNILPIIQGPEFEIRGNRIGLDKFEHAFWYGYFMFKDRYLKKKGIHELFIYGLEDELGSLGGKGTGVMSYADIAADINGARFWNDILKKNPDLLGRELGPYVICKKGKWIQSEEIDISNYLDAATDEGVNCSKFKQDSMTEKVLNRIDLLEEKNQKRYTCPIFPKKLKAMKKKYGKFSKYLLNEEGHTTMPQNIEDFSLLQKLYEARTY